MVQQKLKICAYPVSFKGSDLSSVDWEADAAIVSLFNPRQQRWNDHFTLEGVRILPLSPHGRVTVSLLKMNAIERIRERRLLVELGVYPCKLS